VLGLIVPTIEAATGLPWAHESAPRYDGEKAEKLDISGRLLNPGDGRQPRL